MAGMTRIVVAAASAVLLAAPCSAQKTVAKAAVSDWGRGTTVSAAAGAGSASSLTGVVGGAAVGWEITPRCMVEGSGLWLDRQNGIDAFTAALKVRAGMRQAGVSPFVEGGFGLYRTSASSAATLPAFYRNRVATASNVSSNLSFTDPSFHVGGGLNLFLSRHIAVQPAVEAVMVRGGGEGYTVGIATIRLAYHFEDHPVTPDRR